MKTKIIALLISIVIFTGCTELMKVVQTVSTTGALTEADVISGLKEALTVGARNSAGKLSALNGYYNDPAVKIPLAGRGNDNCREYFKDPRRTETY